jgi:hypothetical protein
MALQVAPALADFEVVFSYTNKNGTATVTLDQTTGTTSVSGGASIKGALIDYSTPGTISISGLTVSTSGTTGGFRVSATIADSNSPGSPTIANIDTSGLSIKNQTGVSGNSTLTITTGDTGFYGPTGINGTLMSTISGTAAGTNASTASFTFASYIDTTNTQFGTQQGTLPITYASVSPGTSQSGNASADVTPMPVPYSMSQVAQITLANGDKFADMSSSTTLTAPAPRGLVLAMTGLPFVLVVTWLRRQRKALAV